MPPKQSIKKPTTTTQIKKPTNNPVQQQQQQQQQQKTWNLGVLYPSKQEIDKIIQHIKRDDTSLFDYVAQFLHVANKVIPGNQSYTQQEKQFVDLYTNFLSNFVHQFPEESKVLYQKVARDISKDAAQTLEMIANAKINIDVEQILSSEIHQDVIKKGNIGEKQEDNFQIQFMNEMLRLLSASKDGLKAEDLNYLSDNGHIFNKENIKQGNVLDSSNLFQFKQRFERLLKQNHFVKGLFLKFSDLVQKGIINRIQKSQQYPDKKQQQINQLQQDVKQFVDDLETQFTQQQFEEEKKYETKSQQSGVSFGSIKSEKIEKRSSGQQSENIPIQNRSKMNEGEDPDFFSRGGSLHESQKSNQSKKSNGSRRLILDESQKQLYQRLGKESLQSLQNNQQPGNVGFNSQQNVFGDYPNNNSLINFVPQQIEQLPSNLIPGANPFRNQLDSIFKRFEDTARRTHQPQQVIDRIHQMKQNLITAEQRSQLGADQSQAVFMLEEQNRSDLQRNGNQGADLSSVPNRIGIIEYRDAQEEAKQNSLIDLANNPKFKEFISKQANKYELTSQQAQLVENALTGDALLQNIIMDSLETRSHKIIRGSDNQSELNLTPANSYRNVSSQIEYTSQRGSQSESGSSRTSQRGSQSEFGSSSQSEAMFQSDLQEMLGDQFDFYSFFEMNQQYISDSTSDAQNLNPGENPFNQWATMLQQRSNQKVNLGKPFLAVKKGIPLTKISGQDLAAYLFNAIKFAAEISGPISNVILKTYQKQTSVFKDKLVKQETTQFKVKPGAMFRLRCCE